MMELTDDQKQILDTIREFIKRSVMPIAREYEQDDRYPAEVVEEMKDLGMFGLTVPATYGGSEVDIVTYSMIFEEISRGWMSIAGILGTHSIMTHIIKTFGTDEQKQRWLPRIATGEMRGGLGLTEADAGSDVQNLQTYAVRDGDDYIINGAKMFITNALNGSALAVLVKTDRKADPPFRGMSVFIIERGTPGFEVTDKIKKLGYKGLDTCAISFTDCRVPAANLVGGREGAGFKHVMNGLELGRVNVAARAVGVSRAALEDAIAYAQRRVTFGKPIAEHQAVQLLLADMGTRIEASRLLTRQAAEKKERGERCDLETGMAKLFASETCAEVTMSALRIMGGYGYTKEFDVERYYRDAPLMIIGEGTNEILRTVIARNLIKKYQVD